MSKPDTILEGQLLTAGIASTYIERLLGFSAECCVQGKRIIELGAGCGLVGLVFAALGADVLLTDLPQVTVRHKRACLAQHALPSLIQLYSQTHSKPQSKSTASVL